MAKNTTGIWKIKFGSVTRLGLVFASLFYALTGLHLAKATPVPPTDNTSAPYMAAFNKPLWTSSPQGGNYAINRDDFMANWLNRSSLFAEDFCGYDSWTNLACPGFITTGATNWLHQNPNGTVIITMGLMPTGGTYSTCLTGTTATTYYTQAAQRLVSFGLADHTIIRLGHEFNAGFYPWHLLHNNTQVDSSGKKFDDRPENFVALWQLCVNTMRAVPGAANVKFCWNGANNSVPYPISDAYPGDAYVDYVATDVYDQAWLGSSSYPYTTNVYPYGADALTRQQNAWNNWIYQGSGQNGISYWKAIAVAHNKPFAIGEWGLAGRTDGQGGMDNPYFIQQMYNFIQDPANNVAFHVYFDIHAGDGDHQLCSYSTTDVSAFPNSAALFRKLFGMPFPVNTDIGTVGLAGSNDAITVTGAGAGFLAGGISDSFHLSSYNATGDASIVVQITGMSSGTGMQSGVMLRQTTAANAPYAALFFSNGQCVFQSRTTAGGAAAQNFVLNSATVPAWLKLVRQGNVITGYESADGLNWNYAGTQTIAMTGTNSIGVAVSSGSTTVGNTTNIDNIDNYDIDVTKTAAIGNAIIVDDAAATGVVKTGAWTSQTTAADDFYGTDFLWLYHGSATSTIKWSPAIPTTGQYNAYMRWATDSNRSSNVSATVTSASGTTQLACNEYVGGHMWNYMGTYTFNAGAAGNVLLTTAGADGYSISADAVMFVPVPVPTLPPPKVDADIGSPALAGSATYGGGTYTVLGAGSDIYNTSDQFNFVSQSLTGDQTLIGRVTGLTYTNTSAKAGVMVRASTAADSAFVMECVAPNGAVSMVFRLSTGASASYTSVATGITPSSTTPIWVKLVKAGSSFTGYYATTVATPTSTDWHALGNVYSGTLLGSPYVGGLAVTSHNTTTLATGTFDNVSP